MAEPIEVTDADNKMARIALNNVTIRRSRADALAFLGDLFARHRQQAPTGDDYTKGLDWDDVRQLVRDTLMEALQRADETSNSHDWIANQGLERFNEAIRALKSPMDNPTQPDLKGEGR